MPAASIPFWVPLVFIGLVALGYRLSFTRTVKPGASLAIALAMAAFSLNGVVAAFGASAPAVPCWAAAWGAVLALATPRLAARGLVPVGPAAVQVPGSWVPLGLMMGIFAAKFVLGAAAGLQAPVLHSAWFAGALAAVLGALSGGFGARALAIHRCLASAGRPAPAPAAAPGV